MATLNIVLHGESAAIVLPPKVLESLGLKVGDTIDATLGDRFLILRPLDDAARRERIADLTRDVFDRRSDAYQRLA